MTVGDEAGTALSQLALLGEAVAHMPSAAVFVWDDDRNYVAVNDQACALVGRSREELLASKVGDLTADRAAPHFEDAQRRPLLTGSHVVERADGPVEVEWITCHTRIVGLPYLVSVVWRKT